MANLIVYGNKTLSGVLTVSGNKNAALPMMCASLLTTAPVTLHGFPQITDAEKISRFFSGLGSEISQSSNQMSFDHSSATFQNGQIELPSGIRSAVLLIAPMLHQFGSFQIDLGSKGCALGIREIDPHLEVAREFGCKIEVSGDICFIQREGQTRPAQIWLDYQSVTATETFLMFAAQTKGESHLINAACEPHVRNLSEMLVQMGVQIDGIGTSKLVVRSDGKLRGGNFQVIQDHHEVATYAAIGASTNSNLTIRSNVTNDMQLILRQFRKVGLNVWIEGNEVRTGPSSFEVAKPFTPEGITKVEAAPWPYFPADILPQLIGASIRSKGTILFWNKVYEGALFWSSELAKFGVRLNLADPHRLLLIPSQELRPNTVEAPYIIRVVVGLLIAAMQIEGRSVILNADPLKRAHPDLIDKLRSVGAELEWVDD